MEKEVQLLTKIKEGGEGKQAVQKQSKMIEDEMIRPAKVKEQH